MEVREKSVWRVQSGGVIHWFFDESDARGYAADRGVPFVSKLTVGELIARVNELELGRKAFSDAYCSNEVESYESRAL